MPGRIQFTGQLGSGAFGNVYKGKYEGHEEEFAVKVMIPTRGKHSTYVRSCLRKEADALAICQKLTIPHTVDSFAYRRNQELDLTPRGSKRGVRDPLITPKTGLVCDTLTMPNIKGCSLKEKLKSGPLSERETKHVVKSILETLEQLHLKGHIIHRDIKPDNIMLEGDQVYLIDFGSCSFDDRPKTPVGTPPYMAPEVWGCVDNKTMQESYTKQVDLWSLGVLTYECVTGQKPFRAELPPGIVFQIQKHLKNPKDLPFPEGVSTACQQFIRQLLVDKSLRMITQAALAHPWIQELGEQKIHINTPTPVDLSQLTPPRELKYVVRSSAGAFAQRR